MGQTDAMPEFMDEYVVWPSVFSKLLRRIGSEDDIAFFLLEYPSRLIPLQPHARIAGGTRTKRIEVILDRNHVASVQRLARPLRHAVN